MIRFQSRKSLRNQFYDLTFIPVVVPAFRPDRIFFHSIIQTGFSARRFPARRRCPIADFHMTHFTTPKTKPVSIRLTADERALLERRAGPLGLSTYIRNHLFDRRLCI